MTTDHWMLIVVALTGFVVGWQAMETRKAARASLAAAEAAVRSADTSRQHLRLLYDPLIDITPAASEIRQAEADIYLTTVWTFSNVGEHAIRFLQISDESSSHSGESGPRSAVATTGVTRVIAPNKDLEHRAEIGLLSENDTRLYMENRLSLTVKFVVTTNHPVTGPQAQTFWRKVFFGHDRKPWIYSASDDLGDEVKS